MDMKKLGDEIIANIGGETNIKSISHCATRLRVTLENQEKFAKNKLEQITGVFGVSQFNDQYQIIIGPGVGNLYKNILKNHNINSVTEEEQEKAVKTNIFYHFLQILSGCVTPLVPIITAAGFVKVALAILSMSAILHTDSQTYIIFDCFASAVFNYFPLLIAVTSAEKFGCSKIMALGLVSILIYPDFSGLLSAGKAVKLFEFIPVASSSYGGSFIPSLLTVYVLSKLEHLSEKIIPDSISPVLRPLFTFAATGILMITILGPVGYYAGYSLVWLVNTLYDTAGWLCLLIIGILSPFLGMTGMHLALFPIAIATLASTGYEKCVLIVFFISTISNGIAALAVCLKTKDKKLKQTAASAAFATLVGGVGEPSLFAVNTRLKKPLIGVMAGSGTAGVIAGILGLKAFAMGAYSVISIPAYISSEFPNNFTYACIVAGVTIIVTFTVTWIIGFDDSNYDVE